MTLARPAEAVLAGRRALVTGGSSGIGRMIAEGLATAGAEVHIAARGADRLASAVREIAESTGAVTHAHKADVGTSGGIASLVAELGGEPLHILVNNAGVLCDAPIDEYPEEGWDDVFSLNLKACFFLTQKVLPNLRAAATRDGVASVINIGSVGGLRVGPRETYAYAAAKAGLHHLTGSLAKRLGPESITVNCIAPGFFPSAMTPTDSEVLKGLLQQVPRRRVGEARDIAALATFLASPVSGYLTGAVIPLDGGMSL